MSSDIILKTDCSKTLRRTRKLQVELKNIL